MKHPQTRGAACAGWTLLEALLALAVVALLLLMAGPPMAEVRTRMQMQALAQDLLASLLWARSEALQRQLRVTVCASADASVCDPEGRWERGWLVFEDRQVNGRRDPEEPVLQQVQGPVPGFRLRGNALVASQVSYTPLGRSQQPSGAFQAGTLRLCAPSLNQGWRLVINALGKPRLERETLSEECR